MTAVLTYVIGARVRRARGRALRIASQLQEAQDQLSASHEELRQWSAHLEQEGATKTSELEERNRHLSIVNATSFALREATEDEPAFERALRLVGRLLQARWVQTRLSAEEDTRLSMLVAVKPDAGAPSTAADDLLLQVARSGVAVFSEIEAPEFEVEVGVPAALGGYAVVPLISKGKSFGALGGVRARPRRVERGPAPPAAAGPRVQRDARSPCRSTAPRSSEPDARRS